MNAYPAAGYAYPASGYVSTYPAFRAGAYPESASTYPDPEYVAAYPIAGYTYSDSEYAGARTIRQNGLPKLLLVPAPRFLKGSLEVCPTKEHV